MEKSNQPLTLASKPLTYVEALKILTPSEVEVLDLIESGLSSKEIALEVGISEGTVRKHRDNIREKLEVNGPNGTWKWLSWVKIGNSRLEWMENWYSHVRKIIRKWAYWREVH